MLDAETKSRIDSARDILVGKVPDPKSQVEQITIALIYKFMDDMDRQSEEIGGKVTFFTGEFRKYAWSKLLDKKIGGQERLLLYAEGIEKMDKNKNIPQLFRDIFKGVFLPYRDPETLNLFLKEINGFSYDHSERLGDAFEYLLSVMDSQGDAGQFRTPRHIIDFIVQIVDPKKNETVLDPACGTAGFLISSYKHILAQNTKDRPGDQLTADERGRLMTNFCGYDISPDMVRLSRVNMYLHSFANPRIHEYDTLTSEERWDERYDVILANPPFMTPKGGIRPHNRFSIKAKRSEVLFVDYIAEHLNVNGRAGVIVPEGIIFQAQNAYKKLRKELIDNYLWCVVSLPAGCFNPYSGVKTSVLLMDKSLIKRTDGILFVKIENDGFDLGAQRRPIEKNDLPEGLKIIQEWKSGHKIAQETKMVHAVSRKRLLESGDCNLSGDRYRDTGVRVSGKWPMVKLGDISEVNRESCEPSLLYGENTFVYVDISSVENGTGRLSLSNRVKGIEAPSRAKRVIRHGDILLSTVRPNLQAFVYIENVPVESVASTGFAVLSPDEHKVKGRFLYNLIFSEPVMRQMMNRMGKGSYPSITQEDVSNLEIPLPPIEVQEKIVAELDGYRKIIEGAKQVITNYKPTIKIDPEWPMVKLGEIVKIINGRAYKQEELLDKGKYPVLRVGNFFTKSDWYYSNLELDADKYCDSGDLLYAWSASFGPQIWQGPKVIYHYHIWKIETSDKINKEYLYYILKLDTESIKAEGGRGIAMIHITKAGMEQRAIPVPHLDIQIQIAAELEAEKALVEKNRKLIEIFKRKIQATLAEIWGEV